MFGHSVRGAPTMASADFWPTIPAPLDASSPHEKQNFQVVDLPALHPHLQCACRPASRHRLAGSPHAARNPRLAPNPLPGREREQRPGRDALFSPRTPGADRGLGCSRAANQISAGIAHPPSRLCQSGLRCRVPCKCRASTILDASPHSVASSASCSSGQRFAFGFLQIRSHPRHPCRSANGSPCRVRRGLPPPSECALPGAPKKKAASRPLRDTGSAGLGAIPRLAQTNKHQFLT